ncbi:MAG TPA: hypothetical protein VLU91_06185 [Nitrososphaerales archaeon]|nr:hypothetical protein [Nitrososphaerales archaeon]
MPKSKDATEAETTDSDGILGTRFWDVTPIKPSTYAGILFCKRKSR